MGVGSPLVGVAVVSAGAVGWCGGWCGGWGVDVLSGSLVGQLEGLSVACWFVCLCVYGVVQCG